MQVYAAEHCECIYESGFSLISIHSTKAGAYKAMRKHIVETYNGYRFSWGGQVRRIVDNPLSTERWRIKTYDVEN